VASLKAEDMYLVEYFRLEKGWSAWELC